MQAAIVLPQEQTQPARPVSAPTTGNQTDSNNIIQFRNKSQASQSQPVSHKLVAEAVEAWFKRTVQTVAAQARKEKDSQYDYTADLAAALSMFSIYPARNNMMTGDYFVIGEYVPEECVAVYRLMSLEYSLNQEVSAATAYKPHLEHGTWELIGFEHRGFPREMWRCWCCGWVTPSNGLDDLNCSGCGEVLMPAEEELENGVFYQSR
jgi:hypothetical protein